MKYDFIVPGDVEGKARPRMNTRTGKAYTPTKTKIYEYMIRMCFINTFPDYIPIEKRVKCTIFANFDVPKSTSKKNKELMLKGEISPTKKPDIDNIIKVVLDAMNGFAFKDDTQVTEIVVRKQYSVIEGLYISIEEV